MKADTPLVEVAQHLPPEAATHLLAQSPEVQEATLNQVRSVIVFWESEGCQLDPITYGTVLNGLVASIAGAYTRVNTLQAEINRLQSLLLTADALIRRGQG